MPTNLLNNDPRLSYPLFRDENGNIPVIKSLNRLGNIVYQIPNDNAQIVYRILVYEASNQNEDVYNNLVVANPNSYRLRLNNQVMVERVSTIDYTYPYNSNGERPRRLTGLKFKVDVPTRGSWGRWQSYSARTASVVRGTITFNAMQNVLREVNQLLEHHIEHENERQRLHRIERERIDREANQASVFMNSVLEHYPLEPSDDYGWRNNFTQVRLSIVIDKYQVAKVFDAIHNVRHMQTNPLDAEYLLKKDY